MNESEAFEAIKKVVTETIGYEVEITKDTHLTKDDILDSLDSAVFWLELENIAGGNYPEHEVESNDLYNMKKLIAAVVEKSS